MTDVRIGRQHGGRTEGRRTALAARVGAALAVVAGAAAAALVAAAPAGAADGPVFHETNAPRADVGSQTGRRWPVSVDGTFVPLPMRCGVEMRVLWYSPGAGADSLWRNLVLPESGAVTKLSVPLTVNGTYQAHVGDFDGDGCDDVLWYAPGPGADSVWYFAADGTYSPSPVTVNGAYVPVVADFDTEPSTDEVLWYGPGATPESIWVADRGPAPSSSVVRGSFRSAPLPPVGGTYVPAASAGSRGVVWFGPGPLPDAAWQAVSTDGTSTTFASAPASIPSVDSVVSVAGVPMLRRAGDGVDELVRNFGVVAGVVQLRTLPGQVDPAAVVATSTKRTGFTVLHQPGPGTDWLFFPGVPAAATAVGAGGTATLGASCAVVGDRGLVQCWGNDYGRSSADATSPRTVSGISGAASVSVQSAFACAVGRGGAPYCWGDNSYGRLGRPTAAVAAPVAAPVLGGMKVSAVEVGLEHACALVVGGQVRCWGRNSAGQVGAGVVTSPTSSTSTPTLVPGLAGVTEIGVGKFHACAVSSGTVRCWGANGSRQLGDGTTVNRATPVLVPGLSDAVEVSAGVSHSCARRATGAVVCWGSDANNRLGNGPAAVTSPAPVLGPPSSAPSRIAAGGLHSCLIAATRLYCWGSNFGGTLGTGPTGIGVAAGDGVAPTDIGVGTGWTAVSTGEGHSCALLGTAGNVSCWGQGDAGQLGRGLIGSSPDLGDRDRPVTLNWFGGGA